MAECSHCQTSFTKKYSLKRHLESVHAEEGSRLVCEECDKSFSRRDLLARHKRAHESVGDFICHACSRRFWRKDHLKQNQEKCLGGEGMAGSGSSIQSHDADIQKDARSSSSIDYESLRKKLQHQELTRKWFDLDSGTSTKVVTNNGNARESSAGGSRRLHSRPHA